MNWKTISGLIGLKDGAPDQLAKQQAVAKLIRVYDFRVTASGGAMVPPDIAERLANLVSAVPLFSKRDVVLTGLGMILDLCERTPGQPVPELKLGAFRTRGQTNLGFRCPLDMDERLTKVASSLSGVSKRDMIVAGLDLILARCEAINGGAFPSAQDQVVSKGSGQ